MNIDEQVSQKISNNDVDLVKSIVVNYTFFDKIFDDLPIGLCVWDYRLDILMSNRSYRNMTKIDSKEVFAEDFLEMSPEKQPDGQLSTTKMLNLITQTFKEGFCTSFWIHKDTDGNEIPVQLTFKKFEVDDVRTSDVVFMYAKDMNTKQVSVDELDFNNDILYDNVLYRLFLQHLPDFTANIPFCYDIKKSNIKYFIKKDDSKAELKTIENFPNGLIKEGLIYKNDILKFLEIIDNANAGKLSNDDIRLVIEGEPVWFNINFEIMNDKDGKHALAMGILTCIQDGESLKDKEKLDTLTNCYNKDAINAVISDIIDSSSNEDSHTMWIAEVCDINNINFTYGSQFTDLVLIDIANQLVENLPDDVVGRVFGKFVIFSKNCDTQEQIDEKTKEIIKCFANGYEIKGQLCSTECTIGAASYPNDGENLTDLYSSARIALEVAKNQGENTYTQYDSSLADTEVEEVEGEAELFSYETSSNSKDMSDRLCIEIFNILHTLNNKSEDKLNVVTEHIAESLNVDRCFILGKKDNEYLPQFKYEQRPFADDIKSSTITEVRDFFRRSDDQGVMIWNDLHGEDNDENHHLTNSKSLMAVKIICKDGNAQYILVVDMYDRSKKWTDKEANTLAQISKIISVFI